MAETFAFWETMFFSGSTVSIIIGEFTIGELKTFPGPPPRDISVEDPDNLHRIRHGVFCILR